MFRTALTSQASTGLFVLTVFVFFLLYPLVALASAARHLVNPSEVRNEEEEAAAEEEEHKTPMQRREASIRKQLKSKTWKAFKKNTTCHDDTCAICLTNFDDNEDNGDNDDLVCGCQCCNRPLHSSCAAQWLLRSNECPLCRDQFAKIAVEPPRAKRLSELLTDPELVQSLCMLMS